MPSKSAREHRYDLYDLFIDLPEPLVPRNLRLEIDERVLSDGSIHRAVDRQDVGDESRAPSCRGRGGRCLLLHSYQNPQPERLVGAILAQYAPGFGRLTLQRRRARDSRIRTHVDHDRQCLHPAGGGRIPRSTCQGLVTTWGSRRPFRDDLVGWIEHGRNGSPVSDPARGIGPGGRRAGRCVHGKIPGVRRCCRSIWGEPPPRPA